MNPNFLIYKSSAGSGKTYTLVKEYLRIVLNNPNEYKHVIALTFTNKAAAEMKYRIIRELKNLSGGLNNHLYDTLVKENVTGNISEKASLVLCNILHDYSSFSVSTFDSFFHRIIRSFAKELGLSYGFDVILEEDEVADKAVDDLLEEIGKDETLTNYFENFVLFNLDSEKDWKLEKELKKYNKELTKERYRELLLNNKLNLSFEEIEIVIENLKQIISVYKNKLNSYGKRAFDFLDEYNLSAKDFKYGGSGTISFFKKLDEADSFEDLFNAMYGSRIENILTGKNEWYKTDSEIKELIIQCLNRGLETLLGETVAYINNERSKLVTAAELLKTIYTYGLFSAIRNKIIEYKDKNDAMLISDIRDLIHALVMDSSTPFIYEKIGVQYKYYLLDEFQDTSVFQWESIFPLIENSLASDGWGMLVGDVKQSIYRWRNGSLNLLLKDAEVDLKKVTNRLEIKNLETNNRSKKEIVDFNNNVFEKAKDILSIELESEHVLKVFENHNQKIRKEGNGFVDTIFLKYSKENGELILEMLCKKIKELQSMNFRLDEMMILTRDNNKAKLVAEHLLMNGVNVISSESIRVNYSPMVRLIIGVLKFLNGDGSQINMKEILLSLNRLGLTKRERHSLYSSSAKDDVKEINNLLGNSALLKSSLYDSVESIYRLFKNLDAPDTNVISFLDLVIDFETKNGSNTASFIDWWENNNEKNSVVIPEHTDAVNIMTIHKAKGLQRKIVFIPYMNWDLFPDSKKNLIWVTSDVKPFNESAYLVKTSSKLEESFYAEHYKTEKIDTAVDNLNLMYVALTRAEEQMYIYSNEKYNSVFESNKSGKGKVGKQPLKNVGQLLYRSLYENDVFSQDETQKVYQTGAIEKFESREIATETNSINMFSNDWTKKLTIKKITKQSVKEKIDFGNAVHKLLSEILHTDQVKNILERAEQNFNKEEFEKLLLEINSITGDVRLRDFFDKENEIKTEQEIILPGGEILRPDRIYTNQDTANILEIKTGTKSQDHKLQIEKYKNAIIKMGFNKVRGLIYYTSDKELLEL